MRYELKNTYVKSWSIGGDAGGEPVPGEDSFDFDFGSDRDTGKGYEDQIEVLSYPTSLGAGDTNHDDWIDLLSMSPPIYQPVETPIDDIVF